MKSRNNRDKSSGAWQEGHFNLLNPENVADGITFLGISRMDTSMKRSSQMNEEMPSPVSPVLISMIAFAPPLLFLFWFNALSQSGTDMGEALGFIAMVFFVESAVYLVVEIGLRWRYLTGIDRFPWFVTLFAISIPGLVICDELAKPLVLLNSGWCRVGQIIDWSASAGGRFILVIGGRGNIADHKFDHGYLNWARTGPNQASTVIPKITFRPISFGGWNDHPKEVVGDQKVLLERLSQSGLPEHELGSLCSSIWDVLQQANDGKTLTSPVAKIGPIGEGPFLYEQENICSLIWILVFASLFYATGRLTFRMTTRNLEKHAR